MSTRAVPGPHVPPSPGQGGAVDGGFLGASRGTLDGRPVGRARFTAGLVPRGGTLCPLTWDSPSHLSGCASSQLFSELLRPNGTVPTRSRCGCMHGYNTTAGRCYVLLLRYVTCDGTRSPKHVIPEPFSKKTKALFGYGGFIPSRAASS